MVEYMILKNYHEKNYMLKLVTHSGFRTVGMPDYIRQIVRRERLVLRL